MSKRGHWRATGRQGHTVGEGKVTSDHSLRDDSLQDHKRIDEAERIFEELVTAVPGPIAFIECAQSRTH